MTASFRITQYDGIDVDGFVFAAVAHPDDFPMRTWEYVGRVLHFERTEPANGHVGGGDRGNAPVQLTTATGLRVPGGHVLHSRRGFSAAVAHPGEFLVRPGRDFDRVLHSEAVELADGHILGGKPVASSAVLGAACDDFPVRSGNLPAAVAGPKN